MYDVDPDCGHYGEWKKEAINSFSITGSRGGQNFYEDGAQWLKKNGFKSLPTHLERILPDKWELKLNKMKASVKFTAPYEQKFHVIVSE